MLLNNVSSSRQVNKAVIATLWSWMMTNVHSFGSQIIKPLRRTLTLPFNNIFPIIDYGQARQKHTRKNVRNLQEGRLKSYFWCPDVLSGLEYKLIIRENLFRNSIWFSDSSIFFYRSVFQDSISSHVQAISDKSKYWFGIIVIQNFPFSEFLCKGKAVALDCVDHVHSFSTSVTGLPDFWIWSVLIWNHWAGGSNPGRHTDYFNSSFSSFPFVCPGKLRNTTAVRPRQLPSRSHVIHRSSCSPML